jgi:hypothetical protein
MASKLGKAFRNSALFHWYKNVSAPTEYVLWRLKGSPGPKVPHLVKQRVIQEYAREFNLPVLIETGTNYAHMIYVQQDHFREIYSIELDEWRAESARRKFAGRPSIHVLQGDSGEVLPKLLPAITEPCLFWLDGHDFDISTPVKKELDALFKHAIQDHVLLIDDARWFDGRTDYPTIEQLRDKVAREYPGHLLEVKDDIIRIHRPKRQPAAAACDSN